MQTFPVTPLTSSGSLLQKLSGCFYIAISEFLQISRPRRWPWWRLPILSWSQSEVWLPLPGSSVTAIARSMMIWVCLITVAFSFFFCYCSSSSIKCWIFGSQLLLHCDYVLLLIHDVENNSKTLELQIILKI